MAPINSCYHRIVIYCISCLMTMATTTAHGQWKKEMQEGIDTLMQKESYEKAIPMLRKWLKEYDADDAFATYRLAKAHDKLMRKLYIHQEKELKSEYDSTIAIYERALKLVDKKDLRRNKDYYTAIFYRTDFEEENIRAFFKEELDKAESYYGKLAFLRVRLIPIEQSYTTLERNFRAIIAPYKKLPNLYKGATEAEIEQIRKLQLQTETTKAHIAAYQAVLKDNPKLKERQQQQFKWQPIKGMNLYSLTSNDFKRRRLQLFDFGEWSKKTLTQIYGFRKLKQELLRLNEALTSNINAAPVGNTQDTSRVHTQILQWREKLLQYDQMAIVPEILLYQHAKWKFLAEAEETRRIFASIYPDKVTRYALISKLTKQITALTQQVREVPLDTSSYRLYPEFVNQYFGSADNIKNWQAGEENKLTEQLMYWKGFRAKSASLKASIPDSVSFGSRQYILLRSARFNLREAHKNGWYINEQIIYLPDSSFISQGRYRTGEKSRPYYSLMDTAGVVKWIYDFPDKREWCDKVSNIKVFKDGSIAYFAYRTKDGIERVTLEYLNPSGGLVMSRVMTDIPEHLFYTYQPRGIVMVRSQKEGEGNRGFSQYSLEGISFEGEAQGKPLLGRFLMRGHIAGIEAYQGGVYIVANFLEYQDMQGNFSDSRAYTKGGFNVLAINLSLAKGKTIFEPILSIEPIIVTALTLEEDDKLRLNGLQGAYQFYSKDNITGGQPWQKYIAP